MGSNDAARTGALGAMTPEQQQAMAVAQARLRLQRKQAGEADMRRMADPTSGSSFIGNLAAGWGSGNADIATGVGQRLGMESQEDVDSRASRNAPLMNTTGGKIGNVGAKIAAALPTMFIPGANTVAGSAVIGAGMGATEPTTTGQSVGGNMAAGAIGGAGGQIAGNLLGRAIRPVASQLSPVNQQLAQSATKRGIPLDAADLTGSKPLTVMRDVMSNMPLTADRQAAIQGAKQTAFNRSVANTFGQNADSITPQVASAARQKIGQQFTDLSSRNNLQANQALVDALSNIEKQVNRYATPDVAKIVKNNIDDVLSKVEPGDIIPGRAYREFDSQIGRLSRNTSSGDVKHYLGQLRDATRSAMDSSISGADKAAWGDARRQYANLMTVAPLAAKDEAGDVSGRALLARVLQQNKSAAFTGGGELGELGRIGKAFVAEQTPNSGTAQRLFMQRFLENPIAASYGQAVGGISLPVQSLMNSKAGQSYLSKGLMPITPQQRAMANALVRPTGAALGATYGEQ